MPNCKNTESLNTNNNNNINPIRVDSFDWEDIIEWIVLGAIDAHKFHGKGSFHGKESVEECIEDTIEALKDNALSRYEEIKSEEGE